MNTIDYTEKAIRHIRRKDPLLRPIIKRVGTFAPNLVTDRFQALVWSILSQQISTKAAASIRQRLLDHVSPRPLNPRTIRKIPLDQLRTCGLSRGKAAYLHDLAEKVDSGVVNLESVHHADDEGVIEHLIVVKGIGRWTAEMFLIFSLARPDVLPVDDLGLRAAIRLCDGLDELPTKLQVRDRGAIWAPYRSVATWYLWQSLKK